MGSQWSESYRKGADSSSPALCGSFGRSVMRGAFVEQSPKFRTCWPRSSEKLSGGCKPAQKNLGCLLERVVPYKALLCV